MAYMDFVWKDNETVGRAIPKRLVAVAEGIPWKETVAVGKYEPFRGEVTTYSYKTVFVPEIGIRKPEVGVVKPEYCHEESEK